MTYFHPANLSRPSWQWSQRDWDIFKAAWCGLTPRQTKLSTEIVTAVRSGKRIADIAVLGKISRAYVYKILATQALRDEYRMARFYEKRKNLGRPIDMGGPRDVWIEDAP